MNFLDAIWLIPLFPLLGAVVMWVMGKRFDPQPESPVAKSPELAAELMKQAKGYWAEHFSDAIKAARKSGRAKS